MTKFSPFILCLAMLPGASPNFVRAQRTIPPNDNFSNRIILDGTNLVVTGSNVNATAEPGEPKPSDLSGSRSVWWSWTAPRAGTLDISTAGSDFDTMLAVFVGSSISNLTLAAFNNDEPGAGIVSSRVTLNAVAGTRYQIAVNGHLDVAGSIRLSLTFGPPQSPPLNDNFANSISVSGRRFNASGSNRNASKEPGEPRHAGNLGGKSLWWSWVAAASGGVTVSTAGSRFDTVLGVYRGESVSELVFVAGNDDIPNTTAVESVVTFNAVANVRYHIAVDGYDLASGDVSLRLSMGESVPVPLNDNFANAIRLTGTGVTVTNTNTGASFEPGEPMHAGQFGGKSIWWMWTAPGSGMAAVDTIGSDFDTLLGVYSGSVPGVLTYVVSDDDSGGGGQSAASFAAHAGTVYTIAVDGWDSASGSVTMHVSFLAAPAPKLFVFPQTPAQIQTNGFVLHLLAPSGFEYVLQHSADLDDWSVLETNRILANAIVTLQDPGAAFAPRRFYRILRLP